MKSIKHKYEIKAKISEVWKAFTDPKIITSWGAGPAKMSDKEGGTFSLWGGDIHGKNIKVVKEKLLVQEWMAGKWDDYSIVTINLSKRNGHTMVELTQTGVPTDEFAEINDGWKRYYMDEMRKLLENSK